MVERLPEGANVFFANPPQVQGFADYARFTSHEISAGLGIPYWLLTGDLSQFNFASGRMGWIDFYRSVSGWQQNMVIPMACRPIERWFNEAVSVVTSSSEPIATGWTPPTREMIDPGKEIAAAKDAIRSGLSSRSEEQRKRGYDPEVLEDEIAEDNTRADDKGLVFDSDPRTDKGAATSSDPAPAADPAPPEDGQGDTPDTAKEE